ncbi:NAD(P)H-binding protein [Amycolatopsis sp. A133]|uniref:NAD(P)H-binding protein n=1 Tax=Amycolatopsis sp. A133 TaxID=3064472 RepID=UPI0027F5359A|nr:NAD(P)H-binding protein [Amycolatopsis sp. A133]MDQ7805907.1 NAD(P)H-binding protein [Amycolatopsis sp. A133]
MTAVVRDPARLELPAEVVVAGLKDREKLAAAVEGRDAVISAVGSRDRGSTTVCVDGARAAIDAGASRLDGNVRTFTIRRADVAAYLLDAVADPTLIRAKVSIAHG